jgi:hypothetical protein
MLVLNTIARSKNPKDGFPIFRPEKSPEKNRPNG